MPKAFLCLRSNAEMIARIVPPFEKTGAANFQTAVDAAGAVRSKFPDNVETLVVR
jgi:hypothetical protein